jgi:hypothetical protein
LYDHLLSLDPKVVFTTNYDKLFEQASKGGFKEQSVTSQGLGHELRRGDPVFVKLHGSIDTAGELVLTRTDFARVARTGREVFDTLRALSLTSTILFVGYSLDDPDIQLVLQAVGRPGAVAEAHFMLTHKPASASRAQVFKESFGVTVIPYTGAHSRATTAIKQLSERVLAARA